MKKWTGFEKGMGIGGWLTNYKRFNVLPQERRLQLTVGDMEHFETYITEKDIAYIASLGMDHIRLCFDQIVVEESEGVYRENICSIIENFIKWCSKYNLNVVLNLHKAVGNYCDIREDVKLLDDKKLQDRFISLWKFFEERFSAYPDAAFEILNEVTNVDPEKWNDLAEKTIDSIREINPDRWIVVGSVCWGDVKKLELLRVFDDEKVVYTFHTYVPFEFTHQRGVLIENTCYYNRNMYYPDSIERYKDYQKTVLNNPDAYDGYDRMDSKFIRDGLMPAVEFMKKNPDKILWCGEFGSIRHAELESRENWMNDVISFLKENKIPYCVWNYLSTPYDGNRFSLVDDDKRRILSSRLADIISGNIR